MTNENTTQKIDSLVKELSQQYPSLAKEDTQIIVSTTIGGLYFSEQGLRQFYSENAEKLGLPQVMNSIREDPNRFFYTESHLGDDPNNYRMLSETPLEELRNMQVYSQQVDMFEGIREFIAELHK